MREAKVVHFHIVEKLHGSLPHALGGCHALPYPCERPAFARQPHALEAVTDAARERWGPGAGATVATELRDELIRDSTASHHQAVVMWREPRDMLDGALWVVSPCECVDGTVAELLAGAPSDA